MSKLLDILSSIDESLKQIAKAQDALARDVNPYYNLSTNACAELIKAHNKAFNKMLNDMDDVFGAERVVKK